jgi:hypothetical protein
MSRWVWEIRPNGTYAFHAEGPGAAQAHSGAFAAVNGRYELASTTMVWDDNGTYRLVSNTSMVASGRLGTATWQRVN